MLSMQDVKVGDTVRVVPLGLLCEVKYNDNGVISGVFDEEENKAPSDVTARLQKDNVVPSRLSRRMPCSVHGVITCDMSPESLVDNEASSYVRSLLESGKQEVKFLAYRVEADKVSYGTYQQVTALEMLGFSSCPSFVVSASMKQKDLRKVQTTMGYPFVSGYEVASTDSFKFVKSSVVFEKVKNVSPEYNSNGYVVAGLETRIGKCIYYVPYPSAVKYNTVPGSVVAFDNGKLEFGSKRNDTSKQVARKFHCPYCGTLISSPSEGLLTCSYENCASLLYPKFEHLVSVLKLPVVGYSWLHDKVESKQVVALCDVMQYEPYSNVEVTCTASDVVRAVCPVSVRVSKDFFDKFAQSAGSVEALTYYLRNPEQIEKDLPSLDSRSVQSFVKWISDPENLLTVNTFLDMEQIHVVRDVVKLNVPKLFRGKTIYVDGTFRHGSYSEVCGILRSYGAEVSSEMNSSCNCVIVGDLTPDKRNMPCVDLANAYNVPAYLESTFFAQYDIDKDLKDNGVRL